VIHRMVGFGPDHGAVLLFPRKNTSKSKCSKRASALSHKRAHALQQLRSFKTLRGNEAILAEHPPHDRELSYGLQANDWRQPWHG
jgi:hypothetical protein